MDDVVSGLALRPAIAHDAPALARMNTQLFADADSPNPMSLATLEERMRAWIRSAEWNIVIFTLGDATVGYAVYQTAPDAYVPGIAFVTLRQFFIERDWRSRGIGTAAFHNLRTQCFPVRTKIAISVLPHNEQAMRFWCRLGFAVQSITLMRASTE